MHTAKSRSRQAKDSEKVLQKKFADLEQELVSLLPVVSIARNLREVIGGINVSASKLELQETINALKLAVADIPPAGGGNGADAEVFLSEDEAKTGAPEKVDDGAGAQQ